MSKIEVVTRYNYTAGHNWYDVDVGGVTRARFPAKENADRFADLERQVHAALALVRKIDADLKVLREESII